MNLRLSTAVARTCIMCYVSSMMCSLMIVDANGKKLYAEVAKRLIPCIWNGNKIPCDYVDRAILKASMPLTYKDWKNWERVLTLACSLVKKDKSERYEELLV